MSKMAGTKRRADAADTKASKKAKVRVNPAGAKDRKPVKLAEQDDNLDGQFNETLWRGQPLRLQQRVFNMGTTRLISKIPILRETIRRRNPSPSLAATVKHS